jgi:protein-S-isoprenylcysteine O-methyltransferase Ste14
VSGTIRNVSGILYPVLTIFYLLFIAGMAYSVYTIGFHEYAGPTSFITLRGEAVKDNASPSTRSPYPYCRHPFYCFCILALVTGPVMTYGRLEFAVFNIMYRLIDTVYEERGLRREFGEAYRAYSANVPMRIPRVGKEQAEMI